MKRLFALTLLAVVVLMNACQKETSFENGGESEGTLQSDVSDECLPKTLSGTYVEGTALDGNTNQMLVTADVTKTGTYTIYTDTVNGVYFLSTGVFPTTGPAAVTLKGFGTPLASGTFNFNVIYEGGDTCTIAIPFLPTGAGGPATFTFEKTGVNCSVTNQAGTYTVGTAVTSANTVTLSVNVSAIGTYNITTTAGGITFTGSGGFAATGIQPVVLTATSGTPTTAGANVFTVTQAASTCTFSVNVNAAASPATYTINCASATQQGAYTANTALTAANTVTVNVNVTVVGSYSITGSLNGMTFAASGTFAATGASVPVILTGTGTPTTSGANSIPLTGGTAGCNITVTVQPAAGGNAVFTVDCTSATEDGLFVQGLSLASTGSTIAIDVNVTTVGPYTITTTATNGMTFSATGTFAATGTQTVTLTGSGTPTAGGTFTIPVPSGATPCSFSLPVDPSFGTWSFKEGTTTYSGVFFDREFDATVLPPYLVFYMGGISAANQYFELDLVDVSATYVNAETYNCATFDGTANTGIFYFEGPPPTSAVLYEADPTIVPNSMVVTVTTHNTATKTITGTFAGNVKDGAGVVKSITNGVFTITYP